MTGEQALQCVELAILRVRDRYRNSFPHDLGLVQVLDEIAGHLAEFQLQAACAKKAEAEQEASRIR